MSEPNPENSQSELSPEQEIPQPHVLKPDTGITLGGLPGDLWNAAFSIDASLSLYKGGDYSEGEFREKLRQARIFNDYYRGHVRKANEIRIKKSQELYDEDASIVAQRAVITNQEAITHFDEKMMELRKLADDEVLDIEKIKKIIWEEIKPIVYGKGK